MGKVHRLPFPLSQTTHNAYFELIYCDMWGPSPNCSSTGYDYYMSLVDAYFRFTWIYLLKSKSEALSTFKQFKNLLELLFGFPVKFMQSNWLGELRPFTSFLTELGIVSRVICIHTHHQNGVIERKHRYIVDLGLTLLNQASLPLTYWDYDFSNVVYLINRLPFAYVQF